jgi:hypothetical protein
MEGWRITPGAAFGVGATLLFAFGAALTGWIAFIILRVRGWSWPQIVVGGAFLTGAVYSAGLSLWSWRARRAALSIGRDGRVAYAGRELCAADSVAAIRLQPARSGEAGDCEVVFVTIAGELVGLPPPLLSGLTAPALAAPLAARLAELLEVPLNDTRTKRRRLFGAPSG